MAKSVVSKLVAGKERTRPDGRRPLLVYLDPTLIKDLKKAALDRDVTAFSIVEEAVFDWLGRHKAERPKP
jgi:hypothetical protein